MVKLFKMLTGSAVDNINMDNLEQVESPPGTGGEGGQITPIGAPASPWQQPPPQDPFDKINKDENDMDEKVHETLPQIAKDQIDFGEKDFTDIPVPSSGPLQELIRIPTQKLLGVMTTVKETLIITVHSVIGLSTLGGV